MVGSELQVTPLLGSCSVWQKAPSGKLTVSQMFPDYWQSLKKRLRNIRQRLYLKMLLFTRNERFVFGDIIFLKSGKCRQPHAAVYLGQTSSTVNPPSASVEMSVRAVVIYGQRAQKVTPIKLLLQANLPSLKKFFLLPFLSPFSL